MSNPKISVIIPVYNHDKFIGRALRSIIDQSLKINEYEIIVVNDASSDNSKKIITKFNERIVYVENKKNMGLPFSLNIGIKKAKGQYLVRLDSDDYVNKKYLEVLYDYLNLNGNFDAVSCDYYIVNDQEEVLGRGDSSKNPIGCGIMFRLDKLNNLGLYNPDFLLHEDKELMQRFREKKYCLHNIKLPLYRYRKHENNITNNQKKMAKFFKILNKKNEK